MSGLESFAVYIAIAAVLVALGNLKGMGWFRRGLDRAANRRTNNLGDAKVIAGFGDAKKAQTFAGRTTFKVSLGTRALSVVLTGALLVLLFQDIGADKPLLATGDMAVYVFLGGAALALVYLSYIFRYALVIDGFELHVPRYLGGHTVYDLRGIEHMEDDGAYMLRIWFETGQKAEILKYVEGRAALMRALESYLANSKDGVGGLRT